MFAVICILSIQQYYFKMKKKVLSVSNWLFATVIGSLGFTSCNKLPWEEPRVMYGTPYATYGIKGKVVNNLNQPVPAIQVIADSNNGWGSVSKVTLTTDAKGEFEKTYGFVQPLDTDITLQFSDIDGDANGLYKPTSKIVSFKKSELAGAKGWNLGSVQKEVNVTLENDVQK